MEEAEEQLPFLCTRLPQCNEFCCEKERGTFSDFGLHFHDMKYIHIFYFWKLHFSYPQKILRYYWR